MIALGLLWRKYGENEQATGLGDRSICDSCCLTLNDRPTTDDAAGRAGVDLKASNAIVLRGGPKGPSGCE